MTLKEMGLISLQLGLPPSQQCALWLQWPRQERPWALADLKAKGPGSLFVVPSLKGVP